MPSAQAKYCLGGAAKFLEPGNKELRLLLDITLEGTSGALISTSLPKSNSVMELVNPPSPGAVAVKTYRLIRWSSFPIQYSTRRSSRGSASPISIPGGTNATRWSTSTPSSCSSPPIAKLLRSDGSIGILSKGVSRSESRVSTFHSPVGGILVYTVTPIVIASRLIVIVSLSVAKVVLPVVSN